MIVTARNPVPVSWIVLAVLPWSAMALQWWAMGSAFVFSLQKFVENPAGLTFILSLPALISMIVNPAANFISDRIWTRWGRRKPFIVVSWCGTIAFLFLIPLMPNFWSLVAAFLLFNLFNELAAPVETLKQEIVPPAQRVRSAAMLSWIMQFALLLFYFIALGRFDDHRFMLGSPMSGERALYWTVALAMGVMLFLVTLGIKETNPHSPLRGQRIGLGSFFRGVSSRDLWPVYLLITGSAIGHAGIGVMGTLLYTEQWGFTKQEMGTNFAIGGVLNLFIIGMLGIFAEKLPRMKAYQVLIVIGLVVKVGFWVYVHHLIPDRRPSLLEVVVFGELLAIVSILIGMVYGPLVYDYVPRNEMGTYAAGANLLNRLVGFLTLNGVGLFISGYAALFLPPAGDMARVVLAENREREALVHEINSHPWRTADSASSPAVVDALPWYGNGAALDHGRAFELRLTNPDSKRLAAVRGKLEGERDELRAKLQNARAFAEERPARREQHLAEARALETRIAPLEEEIARITATLAARGEAVLAQARAFLGDRLMPEGAHVLGARRSEAELIVYRLDERPATRRLERTLNALRSARPDVIDLRPAADHPGLELTVSRDHSPGEPDLAALGAALREAAAPRLGVHLPAVLTPETTRRLPALALDLLMVEPPLDTSASPINRLAGHVVGWVADPPAQDRRAAALARALREPGRQEHTRVLPLPGLDPNAVRVLAVESAPDSPVEPALDEALDRRLATWVPEAEDRARLVALHDRVAELGAGARLNVARTVLGSGYAPMVYDYMSGYIWMFLLGLVGLGITIAFARREARGLIRKRGVEEAEAAR